MSFYVICGPSGVGKGTIIKNLLAENSSYWLSVSATTRDPRPGEIDGQDYFFVSHEQFDEWVNNDQMLEWATVHQVHRYGTPRDPVFLAHSQGRIPILEVDLKGARQIRSTLPQAKHIFITPPSWQELEFRLRKRGTETEEDITRRLATAKKELDAQNEFDYIVCNDIVARATNEIINIMNAS